MIAQVDVKYLSGYLSLPIAFTNAAGVRVDPTSSAARIYRQSPDAATLTLIESVDLARLDNQIGFWGTGLDVSEYDSGLYVVLFRTVFAGGINVASDTFVVEAPDEPDNYINLTSGVDVDSVPAGPGI